MKGGSLELVLSSSMFAAADVSVQVAGDEIVRECVSFVRNVGRVGISTEVLSAFAKAGRCDLLVTAGQCSAGAPVAVEPRVLFSGLVNQASTCFVNSVIQCLFHLEPVREAVLGLSDGAPRASRALRDLFRELDTRSSRAISTTDFTSALGWTLADVRRQGDPHEFLIELIDGIPEVSRLFSGMCHYDRPGAPREKFSSISLQPYQSFGSAVQLLNQQGARLIFDDLPSILLVSVSRFSFNRRRQVVEKNHASFCFADREQVGGRLFDLFAVLVHRGPGANSGHYFAFIRTDRGWYKFNDSAVTEAKPLEAIDANYGGGESKASAYLLVYLQR